MFPSHDPGVIEELDHYRLPIITNGFTLKYGSIDNYGRLYPMSKAKLVKSAQDNINHYVSIQGEHADRAMQKIAYWEGGLTENGKNSIRNNDPYGLVEKNTPGAIFEPIPQGGTIPENKDMQNMLQENINKIVGTTELRKSGRSDAKFATQDALKEQAFQELSDATRDALGD